MERLTRKIELEIYHDQYSDFCKNLIQLKSSKNPNIKDLKQLLNSIKFDWDTFIKNIKLSEIQKNEVNNSLRSLWEFCKESEKNSIDYFTVSKTRFDEFISSDFSIELTYLFSFVFLSRALKGIKEKTETRSLIASPTDVLIMVTSGLSEWVYPENDAFLRYFFAANLLQINNFKGISNADGNLKLQTDTSETFEFEIFIEKENKIKKEETVDILSGILSFDVYDSVYLIEHSKKIVQQFKPEKDELKMRVFENVTINKKNKIDFSKNNLVYEIYFNLEPITHSILDNILAGNIIIISNKWFKISPIDNPYKRIKIIQSENSKSLKETEVISIEFEIKSAYEFIKQLENEFGKYFLFPESDIKYKDKIVVIIYKLLKKHFPKITQHTNNTLAGFIAAQMGLLKDKDSFKQTKNVGTYRKYIRDNVNKSLNRKQII